MGDFNYPEIDWIEESTPPDVRHKATQFMEAVRDSFLVQHVKEPTHYRSNQTPNLLDLVFTNEEGMISKITHSAPLGKSHHQILNFKYQCYTQQKKKVPKLNFNKGDYNELRSHLKNTSWECMESKDIESQWEFLQRTLNTAISTNIPRTRCSTGREKGKLPLWTNEKALIKVKKKRAAYKRYTKTREGNDYLIYARARNQAKQECRNAVYNLEKQIALEAKTNPKAFFAYVRNKMKTRETITDLEDEAGNTVSNDSEKASLLNNFFCSVFTEENSLNSR
ncbi:hypothetical protein SNE40_018343 [Patella caerulea]|uniref:Endonuclease/exonuclease/phosphatase domain-containing protein n=1 Tax=Patella caerulea TaxID=87958 RepID=A0AAN8JAJ4_PATCE